MIIKQYQTGILEVNTYVLIDEGTKKAAIIDIGGKIKDIMSDLKKEGITAEYILCTHGHFDHVYGAKEAQVLYNLPVYMHSKDVLLISKLQEQLEMWNMPKVEAPNIDKTIEDNDEILLGNLKIKVLHTPGHTPGSVGFLCDNVLFSGDTLFRHSIGRTDLPLGNNNDLVNSVKEKFLTLPDDTRVLSGHDIETSIGEERQYNDYLQ